MGMGVLSAPETGGRAGAGVGTLAPEEWLERTRRGWWLWFLVVTVVSSDYPQDGWGREGHVPRRQPAAGAVRVPVPVVGECRVVKISSESHSAKAVQQH